MSKMTLEQVRDWHREKSRNIRQGISAGSFLEHNRLATAIDTHLAKAGASAVFILDGVTVQIHGDPDSMDRVMQRIYQTSARLGNFLRAQS